MDTEYTRASSSWTEKGTNSRLAVWMPILSPPKPFSARAFYSVNLRAFEQLKIGLSCDDEFVAFKALAKLRSRQKQ